jgi:hypothetical protein
LSYAIGEDRSAYQGIGGWGSNTFGICKFTEDTDYIDDAAQANWRNLKEEGKVRGAYHFFHPASNPATQARFFVGTVAALGGFQPGDMFILDSEISVGADGTENAPPGALARMHVPLLRMSAARMESAGPEFGGVVGAGSVTFLEEVVSLVGPRCPVLLYSYLDMARTQLTSCRRFPLYIADYTFDAPDVSPWADWTIWQHADSGGYGGGDADYFNGDETQLRAWLASYSGNWTEAMVNMLPTLRAGSRDAAGQAWYVHRMQVLVAGVGRWSGLGKVTQIADDGVFGAATVAAVKAVQKRYALAETGVCDQVLWEKLIG